MPEKPPEKPPEDPLKKYEGQPEAESPLEQAETPPTNDSGNSVKEKIILIRNAEVLSALSEEGENGLYFKLLMISAEMMEKAAQRGRRRAVLFTLTEEDYERPFMPFALPSYKPQKEWLVGAPNKLRVFLEDQLHLTVRIELLKLIDGSGYRYCLVAYWPKSTAS